MMQDSEDIVILMKKSQEPNQFKTKNPLAHLGKLIYGDSCKHLSTLYSIGGINHGSKLYLLMYIVL